ncbi:MAG TPA: MBL fold metallo-hydrolase [Dehalococcoidia bacterium]|jgi:glyoxylase-like metal-dependent hydrolase (beta-lactamase superfamily II)|nr:MBL fold metallo-hydrolase [Chloroflexota bacterium]HIM59271.1 MBL fold metallo-hydrolase [Dehalococcoidia bacterium]
MTTDSVAVRLVSDGTFLLDGGPMFGSVPKILWEQNAKPDRKNRVRLGLNSLLIKTPHANILVDAGIGNKEPEITREIYGHSSSKLLRNLRHNSVSAREIDFVILTHLAFSHSGGATRLDREGTIIPTFPKAKYLVQRAAWDEAFSPNERSVPMYGPGVEHLRVLDENGMIELLDGDTEVVPGVSTIVTDGYSDGHQVVLINTGSERIIYLANLIPTPNHIPLPYITAFDRYPDQSLAMKKELLDRCEKEGWLMVFAHGYHQSAGYLERRHGNIELRPVDF